MPFSNKKIAIEPISDSNSGQVDSAFLQFYKIVEQAPIAMAIVGMDGTIGFINRKAIAVFGYLPEDIPTMERWWVQAYPDEAYRNEVVKDWTARVTKALATGSEIEGNDYQTTCKDKTVKTMFINGAPVVDKIFVMFDDITRRKKSETALRESENRLRSIIAAAPVGMGIVTNRVFTEVNERICSMTGYRKDELIGQSSRMVYPDDADYILVGKDKYDQIHSKGIGQVETRWRCKDGRIINILLGSAPLDRADLSKGVTFTTLDITEHRRFEEIMQRTAKLDSLGVLAGGIAHDFNNLLTGIFGCIDLSRTVTTNAQVREYLDIMFATMNRAKALTHQLLTFAKGGAPIQKVTPLNPFIPETAQFALSGSNVMCKVDMPENLWQCSIDRNQISQVIDNIVINAQQAMPSGGTIELSARNISFDDTGHPPLTKGNYVMISIKDFGIGIPAGILPRIFDPFYTTKAKGHGLGLATCYSIINRHGGCIDVVSEPGIGSTFQVYLPATAQLPAGVHADVTALHKGNGTIVVVDDEEVVRTTFTHILQLQGYTVQCFNDGREALDFLVQEMSAGRTITALIFDLTIPGGMGGHEAGAEIRKQNPTIPIFVASGYADDPVMQNPAAYGFTGSIAKPFSIEDLSAMLNTGMKSGNESG